MKNSIIALLLTVAACEVQGQTDDAMSLSNRYLTLSLEDAVSGSARYSAMAGARIAIGEDISTIRENPAGLGLYTQFSEVSVTPAFILKDGNSNIALGNAGGVFIIGNNHKASGFVSSAIGFSYHRLRDFDNKANYNDSKFNEEGYNGMWSAGYGANFGNRHFFGLGLNFIYGNYEQNSTNLFGSNTFKTSITGMSIKAGTVLKLMENFNIAFALHSPTRYNYEETRKEKSNQPDENDGRKNYIDMEHHQWGPLKIDAGLGWYIGSKSVLDIEYSYQDYSAINAGSSYDYFNDVKDYVETYMNSCHTIRAGFETKPATRLKVRAGLAYTTSPADTPSEEDLQEKDIRFSLILPHDALYVCAGAGYEYQWLFADLAYVYKHQKADLLPTVSGGNYNVIDQSTNTSEFLLTVGVKF